MSESADSQLLDPTVIPVGSQVSVKVPASSANLGPGYDSLGISLAFFDEISVRRIETGLEFDLTGEGSADLPHDESHLLVQAMKKCWEVAGLRELPAIRLTAHNRIPHSRGMGSSASAIVAGVVAANQLLPEQYRLSSSQILQVCSDMEGHPDNVAPSLYGQLTISWGEESQWRSLPISVHPEILPVVAIPDYEVPTKLARSLLPATLAHADAAKNSGRAALLTQALSQAPEFLFEATEDFIHQSYRAQAMQPSASLLSDLRSKGFPAAISGAGPTVIVFARGEDEREAAIAAIKGAQEDSAVGTYQGKDLPWEVMPVNIDSEGVIVLDVDSTEEHSVENNS